MVRGDFSAIPISRCLQSICCMWRSLYGQMPILCNAEKKSHGIAATLCCCQEECNNAKNTIMLEILHLSSLFNGHSVELTKNSLFCFKVKKKGILIIYAIIFLFCNKRLTIEITVSLLSSFESAIQKLNFNNSLWKRRFSVECFLPLCVFSFTEEASIFCSPEMNL